MNTILDDFGPTAINDLGGIWLIQDRCEPLARRDQPKRVPEFLADLKRENWGWLHDRPVCFDYGNHSLFTQIARRNRLMKAKWR